MHMHDLSSIWMIYHAAADAAATIGEMYLKENIFEKNGTEKMTLLLLNLYVFQIVPGV